MLKCSKVKPDEMYSPVDLYCWHPDWRAAGPGQFFVCDESLMFQHYTKHHNHRTGHRATHRLMDRG